MLVITIIPFCLFVGLLIFSLAFKSELRDQLDCSQAGDLTSHEHLTVSMFFCDVQK